MPTYTQANRAIAVRTPLGPDALLLEKVSGTEAISELFCFHLEMLAPAAIDFGKVLNQPASVRIALPNGSRRLIHGIITALTQGSMVPGATGKDAFLRYTADLVPALWRLSKRVNSRVFQNLTVRKILETILTDDWQLDVAFTWSGTCESRNYCTQYQESDLAFVSRLMEEEGIGYYFRHETDTEKKEDKHTLVVTDAPSGYVRLPGGAVVYQPRRGGTPGQPVVWDWSKRQEVPSGQYTLSDYHFQVPDNRLVASVPVDGEVVVGKTKHPLRFSHKVRDTEMLEVFAYPGEYSQRFDAVDGLGNKRGKEMQKLHDDGKRTARLRAEEAAAAALRIDGAGDGAHFLPGHQFSLTSHFDGNGDYLLARVEHTASIEGAYTSGDESGVVRYENRFQAIPAGLPYRPRRVTPRPRIDGIQTATVTGPTNAPIWIDLYGRVKIKFNWDRSGPSDGGSSCWVRVAQAWAGPGYGAFFWPRIDHEVVVSFEDGDPDRPLITGSVYNDANMPPFGLPANQNMTGIKSASMSGDPFRHASWLVFHDDPGNEHFHLHSETNEVITSGGTKRQFTPGPRFEFSGGLPGMSSGSGGGLLPSGSNGLFCAAFPPPGSGSGGGILDFTALGTLIPGASKDYTDWMKDNYPGSASLVRGTAISSIFLGDRVSHTLLGAKTEINVDLEALLMSFLSSKIPAGTKGAFGKGALAVLFGNVGAVNNLVVGPKNEIVYGGAALGVSRTTMDSKAVKEKTAPLVIKVAAAATVLAAITTDILNWIMGLQEDPVSPRKVAEMRTKIARQKNEPYKKKQDEAQGKIDDATNRETAAQQILDDPNATPEQKSKAREAKTKAQADKAAATTEKQQADAAAAPSAAELKDAETREKAEKDDAKPKQASNAWMLLAKRALITRMHALLNMLEGLNADAKTAADKSSEAARLARHVPMILGAGPVVAASASDAARESVGLVGDILDRLAGKMADSKSKADPGEYDVKKGSYSLFGKDVTICARAKDPDVPALPGAADPTTCLNLIAQGGPQNNSGVINLLATKQVYITQNRESYIVLKDKGKGIEVRAPEDIKIWSGDPDKGPRIQFTKDSIVIAFGDPAKEDSSYIELKKGSIIAAVAPEPPTAAMQKLKDKADRLALEAQWQKDNAVITAANARTAAQYQITLGSMGKHAPPPPVPEPLLPPLPPAPVVPDLVPPSRLVLTHDKFCDPIYLVKLDQGAHLAQGPWALGAIEKGTYSIVTPAEKQNVEPSKMNLQGLSVDIKGALENLIEAAKIEMKGKVMVNIGGVISKIG